MLSDVHMINLPKISDRRGNLTFLEGGNHIPFDLKRIYYIYDVPGGESRGAHAHQTLEQVFIAVSGSFSLLLDDGFNQETFFLNKPYEGLYVPKMTWRDLSNFSSGSVCLVLASDFYKVTDYIRDYCVFTKRVKRK